ncbi:hypothetical protein N7530_004377 [Penicillium desertorum]|uniref:Uncharacterized protein n=1 Tax=Penicillium desertorum TaxID=1303715 RepID=A0A9X0BQG4_9EURO|nr:hypothetical protein N7530_004377 [Penicillium desertorum]
MEPSKGSSFGSADTTSSTRITSGLQRGRAKMQEHEKSLNRSRAVHKVGRDRETAPSGDSFEVADEVTCADMIDQGIASWKDMY